MPLCRGLFVLSVLFASGCATSPMLLGHTGSGQVPLATRDQVHDAFGLPTRAGTIDGTRFEEFEVKDGCGGIVSGYRVPFYLPFEEYHVSWDDLQLSLLDADTDFPEKGKNLLVIGAANGVLCFRLFDRGGTIVVDTDERRLPDRTQPIAVLKKQLGNLWAGHDPTEEETSQIMGSVNAIVSRTAPGSFELGMATIKKCGLVQVEIVPDADADPDRHRVNPGEKLRFEFDDSGRVSKVFLNGKYLIAANRVSDKLPKHGDIWVWLSCGD